MCGAGSRITQECRLAVRQVQIGIQRRVADAMRRA